MLLVYSLEPYTVNTKELLSDEAIKKYLAKVSIVTDEQRLQVNNGGNVVQPEDRNAEGTWYYSETTKNFDKLPLMYKGKISFSEMPEDLYTMTNHVGDSDFCRFLCTRLVYSLFNTSLISIPSFRLRFKSRSILRHTPRVNGG